MNQSTAWEKVKLARSLKRPNATYYIEHLFDSFVELSGDRCYGDDSAVIGGIAKFKGKSVTVIAHRKGRNTAENIACNFGMPHPEGYRKAMRLMRQAEKFHRPVIFLIDTPGAFCGVGAEERGEGEAIAQCLMLMSSLRTPTISIIIGEGGSGGALAFALSDAVYMLENAIYSILSPEGFASILWKDANRAEEAAELLKLTAQDLAESNMIDGVIEEAKDNLCNHKEITTASIADCIQRELSKLSKYSVEDLLERRYQRYRKN